MSEFAKTKSMWEKKIQTDMQNPDCKLVASPKLTQTNIYQISAITSRRGTTIPTNPNLINSPENVTQHNVNQKYQKIDQPKTNQIKVSEKKQPETNKITNQIKQVPIVTKQLEIKPLPPKPVEIKQPQKIIPKLVVTQNKIQEKYLARINQQKQLKKVQTVQNKTIAPTNDGYTRKTVAQLRQAFEKGKISTAKSTTQRQEIKNDLTKVKELRAQKKTECKEYIEVIKNKSGEEIKINQIPIKETKKQVIQNKQTLQNRNKGVQNINTESQMLNKGIEEQLQNQIYDKYQNNEQVQLIKEMKTESQLINLQVKRQKEFEQQNFENDNPVINDNIINEKITEDKNQQKVKERQLLDQNSQLLVNQQSNKQINIEINQDQQNIVNLQVQKQQYIQNNLVNQPEQTQNIIIQSKILQNQLQRQINQEISKQSQQNIIQQNIIQVNNVQNYTKEQDVNGWDRIKQKLQDIQNRQEDNQGVDQEIIDQEMINQENINQENINQEIIDQETVEREVVVEKVIEQQFIVQNIVEQETVEKDSNGWDLIKQKLKDVQNIQDNKDQANHWKTVLKQQKEELNTIEREQKTGSAWQKLFKQDQANKKNIEPSSESAAKWTF